MHDIDFLPADYVSRRETRSSNNWLRTLWAILATLIAVGWINQTSTTRQLIARRNELHRQTQALHLKLGSHDVRFRELIAVENRERLLDVLQLNAFPSRWLSTLSGTLPPQVTLREIHSAQEELANPNVPAATIENVLTAYDDEQIDPVERDLKRLVGMAERRSLAISLRGTAPDDQTVSSYLSALQRTNVFDQVHLLFTHQEQPTDGEHRTFAIRLRVLPIPERLVRHRTPPEFPSVPAITQASHP